MAAFCTAGGAAGILAAAAAAKVSVKFSAEPPKLVALRFRRTAVSAGRGFKSLNIRGNSGSENFKVRAMAELVEQTGTSDKVLARRRKAEATHNGIGNGGGGHSRTFLNAKTEEELFLGLQKEIEAKRLPASAAAAMKDVYQSYQNAVFQSGNPNAKEIVLSNMATAFDRILLQFEDPFTFSSYHKAIREPFDYYMFGQNYIRPLIDFRNSYVGNLPLFDEMEKLVMQGHNIVLISNHQSEADPAVIALSLEGTHPYIAERITYIAGDRVVLDPVCKTFSMGRNLLCVYSKKHINDVPQLAEMKRRANARTLKEMALLLRNGGQILWIAPSGGRDRPDPVTKEWFPVSFDVSSVDNMRRLMEHSGVPGHFYPLAVLSHDIMPPPPQVEKEIGEKRIIGYHGVGISLAPEKKFNEIAAGLEDRGKVKEAFSKALYDTIAMHYSALNSAIHGGQGMDASTSFVRLCQPWQVSSGTSTFERLSDSLRHGC